MSSQLTRLLNWCRDLALSPVGLILISNLLFDCKRDRIPTTVVRSLLIKVAKQWRTHLSSGETVAAVADSEPADYFCQGEAIKSYAGECSRLVLAQDLIAYNTNLRKSALPLSDTVLTRRVDALAKRGLKDVAIGKMTGRRPFAWVTQTSHIQTIRKTCSPESLGAMLRDKSGLLHYYGDRQLVEIIYPSKVVKTADLHAPTFIEGSPGLIYRSAISPDRWGITVDLVTHGEGLPEAVHRPLAFDEQFRIVAVGFVNETTYHFRWREFSLTFTEQWDSNAWDYLKGLYEA